MLLFLLAASLVRGEASDGGEPFAWLKLGSGARQVSLGRASVALEGDAYVLASNPAGLASLNRKSLASQTALLSADRRLEHLAFASPLDLKVWQPGMALSLTRFSLESPIERRETNTPEPIGAWFHSGYAFQLGLGSWILDGASSHLAGGLSFRFVSESVGDASGEGMGLDLGGLFRAKSWLSLAFAMKNVLGSSKWSTGHSETQPLTLHLGLAAHFWQRRILATLELDKSQLRDYRSHAGLEWQALPGMLAFRSAWDQGRLCAGLGLSREFSGSLARLDYAFRTDPVISQYPEHRFSLSLEFDLKDTQSP